jgi:phage-related protein
MGRAAQLAVELIEHGVEDVAAGLDKVGGSATDMGDKFDRATKSASDGADRMGKAAEASDTLASKSSQATGGLGALASGLELVGLGPYAAGLQSAAMATDFFSGVGDIANLVLDSQAVASARAKVAMIGQAIATKTTAAAQRVLNLAMTASPVLLIVAGVILLVGALVLAYKRSETFRRIVQGAMSAARAAVEKVIAGFQNIGTVVGKVFAFIGKVVATYVRVYVLAFQLVFKAASEAWQRIQDTVGRIVGAIVDKVTGIKDRIVGVWDDVRDKGKQAFEDLIAPIQRLVDLVQGLLDKIKSIHVPHVDLNPFRSGGGAAPGDRPGGGGPAGGGDVVTIYVTVQPTPGTTSQQATDSAQATMDAIDARLTAVGRKPVFKRSAA